MQMRIGVLADNAERCLIRWEPTATYLSARSEGLQFSIVPLKAEDIVPVVKAGQIDFILANPAFYVDLEVRCGINRIATLRTRSPSGLNTEYGSVIFTRQDNIEINRLNDLHNKHFMAVTPQAFGGWIMTWRAMLEQGLNPHKDLKKLHFANSVDSVIAAVLSGRVDAGCIRTQYIEGMAMYGQLQINDFKYIAAPESAPNFPFIHSTELYPEWPIARVGHVPEYRAKEVASKLLAMESDHPAAYAAGIAGWTVPLNYQPVHDCLRELRLPPYEHYGEITIYSLFKRFGYWIAVIALLIAGLSIVTVKILGLNVQLRSSQTELEESEGKFKAISQSAHDAILMINSEGQITFWNEAAERILGYTENDVLGLDLHDLLAPTDFLEKAKAGLRHFSSTGEGGALGRTLELEAIDRTGQHLPVELSVSAVRLRQGWHAVGILRDISDRKRQEEAISTSERRFRELVGHMNSGVAILEAVDNGQDFIIRDLNTAAEQFIHTHRRRVINQSLLKHFPGAIVHGLFSRLQEIWQNGGDHQNTAGYYSDTNMAGWFQTSIYQLPTGELVLIFNNVTDRIHAEKQVNYHLKVQETVAQTSRLFVSSDQVDYTEILGIVGESINVKRAYLFRMDHEKGYVNNTHEWCAPGIEAHINQYQRFEVDNFKWWISQVRQSETIIVNAMSDLPQEAAAEKEAFTGNGITAMLSISVRMGKRLIGFIGFDETEGPRTWKQEDIRMLQVVSEMIAKDILRRHYLEINEENRKRYEMLFNSGNDAVLAFHCDSEGRPQEISEINDVACNLLGYTRDQLLLQKPEDLFEKTDTLFPLGVERSFFESRFINGAGHQIPIELSNHRFTDRGQYTLLSVIRDISERKRAEAALAESERRYRLIFDRMHESFAVYEIVTNEKGEATDYRHLDMNPAFEEKFGVKRSYFIGKTMREIVPEIEPIWLAEFGRVALTGEPIHFEGYSPVFEKTFDITAFSPEKNQFAAVYSDVTERRREETLRKEQFQFLQTLMDTIPSPIYYKNTTGDYLGCNKAFEDALGVHREDMIGKTVYDLSPRHLADIYLQADLELFKSGGYQRYESRIRYADGKEHSVIFSKAVYHKVDGAVAGLVGVMLDITDRIKSEDDLRRAMQIAKEANEAKSIFLASMSHEIRTPMNAILGFTEIMASRVEQPDLRHYLENIQASGKTLLSLINDILDLSKIEAGKMEIQKQPTHLKTLFHEILQIFSWKLESKDVTLSIEIDPELPESLLLDAVRVRQILLNLVGNAVKFTEKGQITVSAQIVSSKKERDQINLRIAVSDSGIGIPKSQQKIIFEAFRQRSGQSAAQYGGTGLGLAITKRLVEIMHGHITVESRLGRGSTFVVQLKEVEVADLTPQIESETGPASERTFNRAKVLIVDDIPINRELLITYFENHPIEVIQAASGKEAVLLAQKHQPDCILMDLKMPEMDGFAAITRLKARKSTAGIPVIALTATTLQETQKRCEAAGFDDLLGKPVSRQALETVLAQFLPHRQSSPALPEAGKTATMETPQHWMAVHAHRGDALAAQLENQALPLWQEIQKTFIFSTIEKLSVILKNIAESHKAPFLEAYAEQVADQVRNFDMDHLPGTLDILPGLIDQLHTEDKEN